MASSLTEIIRKKSKTYGIFLPIEIIKESVLNIGRQIRNLTAPTLIREEVRIVKDLETGEERKSKLIKVESVDGIGIVDRVKSRLFRKK